MSAHPRIGFNLLLPYPYLMMKGWVSLSSNAVFKPCYLSFHDAFAHAQSCSLRRATNAGRGHYP